MVRRRHALLLGLGLFVLFFPWMHSFSLIGLQRNPINCQPGLPEGAQGLLAIADMLNYPGVQVSIRNRDGQWSDCAAGWADWRGFGTPMTIEHRLRYLSLSKILVSVMVVRLARSGQLDLERGLVDILNLGAFYEDPRIRDITIRQLLSHTAGFDRTLSGDPMMLRSPWCPFEIEALARTHLDFSPGQRFSYSNLGYCLVGKVLEMKTKTPLAKLIQDELLMPSGLKTILPIVSGKQMDDEAMLRIHPAEVSGLFDDLNFEAMHATGAWSGSAANFGRLMEKIFLAPKGLLDDEGRRLLIEINASCDTGKWRFCHGLGLYRYEAEGGPVIYWRDGSLPGGTAFFAISEDGQIVIWLANGRQPNWMRDNDLIGLTIYSYFSKQGT